MEDEELSTPRAGPPLPRGREFHGMPTDAVLYNTAAVTARKKGGVPHGNAPIPCALYKSVALRQLSDALVTHPFIPRVGITIIMDLVGCGPLPRFNNLGRPP